MKKLHYNTVSKTLIKCLKELMKEPLLDNFILVGGTSLSLQLGHRISIDIDLFTDSPYGSVDFKEFFEATMNEVQESAKTMEDSANF